MRNLKKIVVKIRNLDPKFIITARCCYKNNDKAKKKRQRGLCMELPLL